MASTAQDWLSPTKIESAAKLTRERSRAKTMQKGLLAKGRTWASDGEYVYFRRKQANPATLQRHEQFLKTGDYRHIMTQDDVEVYQLMPTSPFRRQEVNLLEQDVIQLRRTAAVAACKRDFGLFIDAVSEMASRIKGARYTDGRPASGQFAEDLYNQHLTYVFRLIEMRQGPSQREIDQGVIAARQARGDNRQKIILLPSGSPA